MSEVDKSPEQMKRMSVTVEKADKLCWFCSRPFQTEDDVSMIARSALGQIVIWFAHKSCADVAADSAS